ncbi:VirB4 family type IV secretion system protein [Paenibacillus jiagnxiensis]|uniref:VirB4 family type IV secretion system protein n=1 Tax=Paenibacillus jiagnxiensis TaxID=3228926 RepID=UPI0033B78659
MFGFTKRKSKENASKDSVQAVMPYKKIEEFMKLKDGFYRACLKITPINQDNLMDEELRDIVEQLQEIMNSEPGTLQIKVSSEPMNMDKYQEYIDETADASNNAYFLERIQNYKEYAQQRKKNSKNQKRFYIVLKSNNNDPELAKEELKNKISIIQEKLATKDMKAIQLNENAFKDLLYRKMNPNTSQEQPFEESMLDHDILPAYIHYKPDQNYTEVDGMYYRYFVITYYPASMKKAGWFKNIINSKGNVELDIFAVPGDPSDIEKGISNSIGNLEARLEEALPAYRRSKYNREKRSQEELLEEIQDNASFEVTVMVTIYEKSLDELERATKRIISQIRSNRMRSKTLNHRYLDPYFLALPLCYNSSLLKKFYWLLHSRIIASIMPFDASEITSQTGVIWGYNPDNESFIIIDRYDRQKNNNGNGVTFGGSGSGKTYMIETELDRNIIMNVVDRAVVVDPEREYRFPYGNRINFEVGGKDCTNPFHFRSTILDEDDDNKDGISHAGRYMLRKTSDLVSWMRWIHPEMSPEEASLTSRVVRQSFKDHRLLETMEDLPGGYEPPTLSTFERFAKKEPKLETLLNILDPYIHGEYKSLFNGQTTWDLNNKLTVLDIYNLQEEVRRPIYDLIFKDVWSDFKRDRNERTGLYADEAHTLVNKREIQTLVNIVNFYKRFRKYNSYIEIITQNIDDILSVGQEYAAQILANSSFKRYLYMKKNDIEALQKIENLSEKELSVIRKRTSRGRGVIIAEDQRAFIQSEASLDQLAFIDPKTYQEIMATDNDDDFEGETA